MLLQVHLHQAQLIAAVAAAQEIQKRAEIPAQGAAVAAAKVTLIHHQIQDLLRMTELTA
jgi:Cu/Ag efflux protein CusF